VWLNGLFVTWKWFSIFAFIAVKEFRKIIAPFPVDIHKHVKKIKTTLHTPTLFGQRYTGNCP
jgi:hypothetical protein